MKTVMVFGTFDIVHLGHIHMFEEARQYGDRLVVAVARDEIAEKIKGTAPYYSEDDRINFLKYLKLIDEVVLGDTVDPYKNIDIIKPDVIALGYDQRVFVDELEDKITSFNLNTQIVRLTPFYLEKFGSRLLKKYIERVV